MNGADELDLRLEQLRADPGAGAQGPPTPRVFVASSAAALARALSDALVLDVAVPSSGAGTYIGACMGLKPSGGFSVAFHSARRVADRVTILLDLHEPGPDEFAIQVTTSPFAIAFVRDLEPEGMAFSFVRTMDWAVIPVG